MPPKWSRAEGYQQSQRDSSMAQPSVSVTAGVKTPDLWGVFGAAEAAP
jgi:hypothetical protein